MSLDIRWLLVLERASPLTLHIHYQVLRHLYVVIVSVHDASFGIHAIGLTVFDQHRVRRLLLFLPFLFHYGVLLVTRGRTVLLVNHFVHCVGVELRDSNSFLFNWLWSLIHLLRLRGRLLEINRLLLAYCLPIITLMRGIRNTWQIATLAIVQFRQRRTKRSRWSFVHQAMYVTTLSSGRAVKIYRWFCISVWASDMSYDHVLWVQWRQITDGHDVFRTDASAHLHLVVFVELYLTVWYVR